MSFWPFKTGTTEIWYAKNPTFTTDGAENYKQTHVLLGKVASTDPERIFVAFQGENWSPNGEARELISSKGLKHTSMSVGDVVVIGGKALVVAPAGFESLQEDHHTYAFSSDWDRSPVCGSCGHTAWFHRGFAPGQAPSLGKCTYKNPNGASFGCHCSKFEPVKESRISEAHHGLDVDGRLIWLPARKAKAGTGPRPECSQCGAKFQPGDTMYYHDKEAVCRDCATRRLRTDPFGHDQGVGESRVSRIVRGLLEFGPEPPDKAGKPKIYVGAQRKDGRFLALYVFPSSGQKINALISPENLEREKQLARYEILPMGRS